MDLDGLERLDERPIFSAIRFDHADLRSSTNEKYKYIVDMTHYKKMLFDILRDPGERDDILRKETKVCNVMHKVIMDRDKFGKTLGYLAN